MLSSLASINKPAGIYHHNIWSDFILMHHINIIGASNWPLSTSLSTIFFAPKGDDVDFIFLFNVFVFTYRYLDNSNPETTFIARVASKLKMHE